MKLTDRGRGVVPKNRWWESALFFAVILNILLSAHYREGWVLSTRAIHGTVKSGSRQTVSGQAGTEQEELAAEDPNSELSAVNSAGQTDDVPVATHLGEWVYRGPSNYGGKVHDLAIHPTDETILFVAYG